MYLVFKFNLLILIILIFYIINSYRCSFNVYENLIGYETDMIDNLSKYPTRWLEKTAELLQINIRDIPETDSNKRNLATAIKKKYPKDGLKYIKYENRNLNEQSDKYLKSYAIFLCNHNPECIDTSITNANRHNLIKIIRKNSKSSILFEEGEEDWEYNENDEEEEEIISLSQPAYPDCPIIYDKCISDVNDNSHKYSKCLNNQNNYEQCMMCFDAKIRGSNYINKGFTSSFKKSCNYKDLELLCFNRYKDTCNDGKYLRCPCIN
jgi:hypothetical protein